MAFVLLCPVLVYVNNSRVKPKWEAAIGLLGPIDREAVRQGALMSCRCAISIDRPGRLAVTWPGASVHVHADWLVIDSLFHGGLQVLRPDAHITGRRQRSLRIETDEIDVTIRMAPYRRLAAALRDAGWSLDEEPPTPS